MLLVDLRVLASDGPSLFAGVHGATPRVRIILLATIVPTLLWAQLDNRFVLVGQGTAADQMQQLAARVTECGIPLDADEPDLVLLCVPDRAIAEVEQTAETRWLHARSIERLGSYLEAGRRYRDVLADDDASVSASSLNSTASRSSGSSTPIATPTTWAATPRCAARWRCRSW